jgi:sodium-independent sulfate anion transporter 11
MNTDVKICLYLSGPVMCSQNKLKKHLRRKIPLLEWLPKYSLASGVSDLIAGLTVGLTVIPQGIAYAVVAGLPPQYGLYSAFIGCFTYTVFGSVEAVTIGPTAIIALMTRSYAKHHPAYAVLLSFLLGILILSCGLLQLGFLIDFISVPVIAGFTSAAALTIISGQWRHLLGLSIDMGHSKTHAGVVDYYVDIVNNITTTRWQDAVLGLSCTLLLLLLRALNQTNWFKPIGDETPSYIQRLTNRLPVTSLHCLDKLVWLICTARNAMIVLLCLVLAWVLDPGARVFSLTGSIDTGIPALEPPPFHISAIRHNNGTDHVEYIGFGSMVTTLGSATFIIPIIAILESVAIAKAFSGGKPVDASQEMIALGLCNILGSFVQSMPTSGSFSRTAVNSASGVKTTLGGLYTGALVLLCLAYLLPYCAFIPTASLAAVIITAVIFSVEHALLRPLWRSKRVDMIPGFVCFLVGLFYELEMGIFSGTVVHLILVLYHIARPRTAIQVKKIKGTSMQYLSITPDQGLVFPSVRYMRSLISKAAAKEVPTPVVIDCCHVSHIDFTAAQGLCEMVRDIRKHGQSVYWISVRQAVLDTLVPELGDLLRVVTVPQDIIDMELSSEDEVLKKDGSINIDLTNFTPIINAEENTRNA